MKLSDARILFVDDEPSLLAIFAHWLSGGNPHRITTAADGQEALDQLTVNDFDLIITDVNMPRMSGIELVRRMTQMGKTPASIVFVSGFGDIDEREMYGLGVEAFLAKPLARDQLIATVERALADRAALWQTPLDSEPPHSLSIQATDFAGSAVGGHIALGRGGFAAPYTSPVAPGKVRFHCEVSGAGKEFSGEGYVRWRSKAEGTIGVEIAYLDQDCRAAVVEQIHKSASCAFIPAS